MEVVGGTVLVVDDNENNRDLLARRLRRQGHTVDLAEDGRAALSMLRAQPYDLMLLDIMMPDLNGYEVLELMKADSTLRRVPVIVISAIDDIDSVVRCIELGAEDYMTKPFNSVLLKARVGACLEKNDCATRNSFTCARSSASVNVRSGCSTTSCPCRSPSG